MLLDKISKILLVVFLATFAISGTSIAQEMANSQVQPQYINKTQYYSGNNYEINDVINGDVYCVGNNITINGNVNGDVLCAGSTIIINGTVNGNVRLFASTIQIQGLVTKNGTLVSQDATIEKSGNIVGDVTTATSLTRLNGIVGRDANVNTNNFEVSGIIGRDLNLNTESVIYTDSAKVAGITTVNSNVYDNISIFQNPTKLNSNLDILGLINMLSSAFMFVVGLIYVAFIIGLLLSALFIALLFPRSLKDSYVFAKDQPATVLLSGFLVLWVAPLIIFLLVWSIIGIPIAIIIWGLYIALLTLSIPFSAHALGSKLFPSRSHATKALGGAALLLLLFAIPVLNIIVFIIVMVFGAGLITRVTVLRYTQARQVYIKDKQ